MSKAIAQLMSSFVLSQYFPHCHQLCSSVQAAKKFRITQRKSLFAKADTVGVGVGGLRGRRRDLRG